VKEVVVYESNHDQESLNYKFGREASAGSGYRYEMSKDAGDETCVSTQCERMQPTNSNNTATFGAVESNIFSDAFSPDDVAQYGDEE
jgi:hypothetical protein